VWSWSNLEQLDDLLLLVEAQLLRKLDVKGDDQVTSIGHIAILWHSLSGNYSFCLRVYNLIKGDLDNLAIELSL